MNEGVCVIKVNVSLNMAHNHSDIKIKKLFVLKNHSAICEGLDGGIWLSD